jgi:hypothetical protein
LWDGNVLGDRKHNDGIIWLGSGTWNLRKPKGYKKYVKMNMWLHMQDLKKDQRMNILMKILKRRLTDLFLTG